MIQIGYKLYNKRISWKYFDRYYWRAIVRLLNISLKWFFKLEFRSESHSIETSENLNRSDKYIVSLTTFPKRIDYVWMVIESILRQTSKPDAIILWLARGEFEGKKSLPANLLKLEERGLQIQFCEDNLMPHKKYFYTMRKYPKANVITVDDDVIYPPSLLSKLKEYHNQYPQSICSILTRSINIEDNTIQPYKSWKIDNRFKKSPEVVQIGVGGVLYPPNSLHPEVLNQKTLKNIALKADDLWLKVMALKNDTEVTSLGHIYPRTHLPIIIEENKQLMDVNIGKDRNDKIFNDLLDWYSLRERVSQIVKIQAT